MNVSPSDAVIETGEARGAQRLSPPAQTMKEQRHASVINMIQIDDSWYKLGYALDLKEVIRDGV